MRKNSTQSFSLKELWVNVDNIISVENDDRMNGFFVQNWEQFPEGLDEHTTFSKIRLVGFGAATDYLQVVGSPESVASKL